MSDPNNTLPAVEPQDQYSIEDDVETTNTKSYSQGQLVRRRFFRHKAAMVSLVILIFIVLLAITSIGFGPIPGWWARTTSTPIRSVNGARPTLTLWPPSIGEHPFGQDTIGKDYFALVMRGTQNSLFMAFTVGIIATIIGTPIGAIAGYYRGITEAFLMRMTDLFIIIPTLVLAAVLGQMTGGNILALALVLALVSWTGLARLVRGEVLSLREREFVMAARAVGTPSWRIIVRHILPNALGTIVVNATLLISAAILVETALSFLGLRRAPAEHVARPAGLRVPERAEHPSVAVLDPRACSSSRSRCASTSSVTACATRSIPVSRWTEVLP